jgi:hypothetical protein
MPKNPKKVKTKKSEEVLTIQTKKVRTFKCSNEGCTLIHTIDEEVKEEYEPPKLKKKTYST